MNMTKDIPQMIVHEPGVPALELPHGYRWDYKAEMHVEHRTVVLSVGIVKNRIFGRGKKVVGLTRELSRKYHIPRALTSMEPELVELLASKPLNK
jgi:hypothetical protein